MSNIKYDILSIKEFSKSLLINMSDEDYDTINAIRSILEEYIFYYGSESPGVLICKILDPDRDCDDIGYEKHTLCDCTFYMNRFIQRVKYD
jgi:hypothetical protein